MNQKNKSIGGSDDIKHLSPDDLIISLYTCLNKLETKAKKEALLLSAQEIDNVDYTKFKNSIDSIQSPEITEDDLKKIITKMKFKTEDILVMHTKIKLFSKNWKTEHLSIESKRIYSKVFDCIDTSGKGSFDEIDFIKYFQTKRIDSSVFNGLFIDEKGGSSPSKPQKLKILRDEFIEYCKTNKGDAMKTTLTQIANIEGFNPAIMEEKIKELKIPFDKLEIYEAFFELFTTNNQEKFTKSTFENFFTHQNLQSVCNSNTQIKIFHDMDSDQTREIDKYKFVRYLHSSNCDKDFTKCLQTIIDKRVNYKINISETPDQLRVRLNLSNEDFYKVDTIYKFLDKEGEGLKFTVVKSILKTFDINYNESDLQKNFAEMKKESLELISHQNFVEYYTKKQNEKFRNLLQTLVLKVGGVERMAYTTSTRFLATKNQSSSERRKRSSVSKDFGKSKMDNIVNRIKENDELTKESLQSILNADHLTDVFSLNKLDELFDANNTLKTETVEAYAKKVKQLHNLLERLLNKTDSVDQAPPLLLVDQDSSTSDIKVQSSESFTVVKNSEKRSSILSVSNKNDKLLDQLEAAEKEKEELKRNIQILETETRELHEENRELDIVIKKERREKDIFQSKFQTYLEENEALKRKIEELEERCLEFRNNLEREYNQCERLSIENNEYLIKSKEFEAKIQELETQNNSLKIANTELRAKCEENESLKNSLKIQNLTLNKVGKIESATDADKIFEEIDEFLKDCTPVLSKRGSVRGSIFEKSNEIEQSKLVLKQTADSRKASLANEKKIEEEREVIRVQNAVTERIQRDIIKKFKLIISIDTQGSDLMTNIQDLAEKVCEKIKDMVELTRKIEHGPYFQALFSSDGSSPLIPDFTIETLEEKLKNIDYRIKKLHDSFANERDLAFEKTDKLNTDLGALNLKLIECENNLSEERRLHSAVKEDLESSQNSLQQVKDELNELRKAKESLNQQKLQSERQKEDTIAKLNQQMKQIEDELTKNKLDLEEERKHLEIEKSKNYQLSEELKSIFDKHARKEMESKDLDQELKRTQSQVQNLLESEKVNSIQLKSQLDDAIAREIKAKEELSNLNSKWKSLKEESDKDKTQIANLKEAINSKDKSISDLSNEIKEHKENINNLNGKLDSEKNQCKFLLNEISNAKDQIQERNLQISELKTQNSGLVGKIDNLEIQLKETQTALQNTQKLYSQLETEEKNLVSKSMALNKEIEQKTLELNEKSQELKNALESLEAKKLELKQSKSEIESLTQKLEEEKMQHQQTEGILKNSQNKIKFLEEDIDNLNKSLEKNKSVFAENKERYETLTNELLALQNKIHSTEIEKAEMRNNTSKLESDLLDKIKTIHHNEIAIKELTLDKESLTKLIEDERLKTHQQSVQIQELTQDKNKLKQENDYLSAEIKIIKDENISFSHEIKRLTNELSLKEENISKFSSVHEENSSYKTELEKEREKSATLNEKLSHSEENERQLKIHIDNYKEKVSEIEKANIELIQKLKDIETNLSQASLEKSKLEQDFSSITVQNNKNIEEIKRVQEDLQKASKETETLNIKLNNQDTLIKTKTSEIQTANDKIKELNDAILNLKSSYEKANNDFKIVHQKTIDELSSSQTHNRQLENEIESLNSQKTKLENELQQWINNHSQKDSESKSLDQEIKNLRNSLEAEKSKGVQLQFKLNESQGRENNLKEELKNFKTSIDRLNDTLEKKKVEINELKSTLENKDKNLSLFAQELNEYKTKYDSATHSLESEIKKVNELNGQLRNANAQISEMNDRIQEYEKGKVALENKINETMESLKKKEAEHSNKLLELETAHKTIQLMNEQIASLKADLDKNRDSFTQYRVIYKQTAADLVASQTQNNHLENENNLLRQQRERLEAQLQEWINNHSQKDTESKNLETLLDTEKLAKIKLEEELQEANLKIKELNETILNSTTHIQNLKLQTAQDEKVIISLKEELTTHENKLVQLTQDLKDSQIKDKSTSSLLETEKMKSTELEARLTQENQTRSLLDKKLIDLKKLYADLERELEESQQNAINYQTGESNIQKLYSELSINHNETLKELDNLKVQLDIKKSDLEEKDKSLKISEEIISELRANLNKTRESNELLRTRSFDDQLQMIEIRKELNVANGKIDEKKAEISSLLSQLSQKDFEIGSLVSVIEKKDLLIESGLVKIEQLTKDLNDSKSSILLLELEAKKLNTTITNLKTEIKELKKETKNLVDLDKSNQAKLKDINEQYENKRGNLINQEAANSQLAFEVESLKDANKLLIKELGSVKRQLLEIETNVGGTFIKENDVDSPLKQKDLLKQENARLKCEITTLNFRLNEIETMKTILEEVVKDHTKMIDELITENTELKENQPPMNYQRQYPYLPNHNDREYNSSEDLNSFLQSLIQKAENAISEYLQVYNDMKVSEDESDEFSKHTRKLFNELDDILAALQNEKRENINSTSSDKSRNSLEINIQSLSSPRNYNEVKSKLMLSLPIKPDSANKDSLYDMSSEQEHTLRHTPRKLLSGNKDKNESSDSSNKKSTLKPADQVHKCIPDSQKLVLKILNWLTDDTAHGIDAWKLIGGLESTFNDVNKIKKYVDAKGKASRELFKEIKQLSEREQFIKIMEFLLELVQECQEKRKILQDLDSDIIQYLRENN